METYLITGYSKAPQGTSMYERYKYSGIILEIDKKTSIIQAADFTFVTGLAKDYFSRLLVGTELSEGIDPILIKIKENYHAPSQQSVIVALKAAYQRYFDLQETTKQSSIT
jgi:hypothetical protein